MEDNQSSRQLALLEPETTAGNQPRVYKSPSSPRPLQSNQLPCLQKLLEPETTAGNQPRVYKSSSSCPPRATGPQVWNRILCPRPLQATIPASSKAVATQKLEHLVTASPTVNQPSPFSNVKNRTTLQGMHGVKEL